MTIAIGTQLAVTDFVNDSWLLQHWIAELRTLAQIC